jgi:hypothetical protein
MRVALGRSIEGVSELLAQHGNAKDAFAKYDKALVKQKA